MPALRALSMEIFSNEILSVIGPSNSGKTSFLRTLNLLNDLNLAFRMTAASDRAIAVCWSKLPSQFRRAQKP